MRKSWGGRGVLLELEGAVADAATACGALGGLVGKDAEVVVDPAEAGAPRRLDALAHLRDVLQNRRPYVCGWAGTGWHEGGVKWKDTGAYLVALGVESESDRLWDRDVRHLKRDALLQPRQPPALSGREDERRGGAPPLRGEGGVEVGWGGTSAQRAMASR